MKAFKILLLKAFFVKINHSLFFPKSFLNFVCFLCYSCQKTAEKRLQPK